ncbi:MAG: hypothetical protein IJD21_07250 [Oscillospiraceae bacterium]|nr:hypothetical protein [Oscillospiraceae bacterium]
MDRIAEILRMRRWRSEKVRAYLPLGSTIVDAGVDPYRGAVVAGARHHEAAGWFLRQLEGISQPSGRLQAAIRAAGRCEDLYDVCLIRRGTADHPEKRKSKSA